MRPRHLGWITPSRSLRSVKKPRALVQDTGGPLPSSGPRFRRERSQHPPSIREKTPYARAGDIRLAVNGDMPVERCRRKRM